MDIDDADKNWENLLFPKVCKLARRTTSQRSATPVAMDWHKRMNAHGRPPPSRRKDTTTPSNRRESLLLQTPNTTGGHQEDQESETPRPPPRLSHHTEQRGRAREAIQHRISRQDIQTRHQDANTGIGCTIRAPAATTPSWKVSQGTAQMHTPKATLCKTEKEDKIWYLAEIEVTYFSTTRPAKAKMPLNQSRGRFNTSHRDHPRSPRVPIQKLSSASEPTRRRTQSARNGGGQGRANSLFCYAEASQALRCARRRKKLAYKHNKTKKNKNDVTSSLNRAASYLKDRGRTETELRSSMRQTPGA
jgi:hypothetical protein